MKELQLLSNILNDANDLKEIDAIRRKYPDDQIAFIDEVAPFYDRLEEISQQSKKILLLFAKHKFQLTFGDIVRYSGLRSDAVGTYLPKMEDAGILERDDDGFWQLENKDFLRYLVILYSDFTDWMKREKKQTCGDIIDQYIASRNKAP